MKYLSKLNTRCEFFFQRPKTSITDECTWYDAVPIGHNVIGSMFPAICEKAGIDKRYTNHSLRATAVHVLDEAEFAGRHIMSITGHKSENSLKTYTGYTSDKALQKMSNVLSDSLRSDNNSNENRSVMNEQNMLQPNDDIVSSFENDENVIDFLLLTDSQMDALVQNVTDSQMDTLVQNVTDPLNNRQMTPQTTFR